LIGEVYVALNRVPPTGMRVAPHGVENLGKELFRIDVKNRAISDHFDRAFPGFNSADKRMWPLE
jgi:hypothetical protein